MFFGLFKNNKEPKLITIIGKYEGSHPKFSHSVFNANPKCDEDGVDLSFNKGRRFEKHYQTQTPRRRPRQALRACLMHQNRRSLRNAFLLG